jgi:hypothetical protein
MTGDDRERDLTPSDAGVIWIWLIALAAAVIAGDRMGDDFQLVPNPQASVPLPDTFRLRGTYFRIEQAKDGYIATPEATRPAGTAVGER